MLESKRLPREMIFGLEPRWLRERKALPPQSAIGQAPVEEPLVKVWVTRGDGKVRQSHIAANGQVRFLGEPFQVGHANLTSPRDPNGPIGETINCRCIMEVVPISQLPAILLPQIENRLTDQQQQFLPVGIRVADAGIGALHFPVNPGAEAVKVFLEKANRIEARLNAGGVIQNLTPLEAWVHYIKGSGNAITVTFGQVSKGIDIVRDDEDEKLLTELSKIKANGQFPTTVPVQITGMSIAVDFVVFGSVEFDISGSIFATKAGWRVLGDVSAQNNPYDFNPGKRPFLAEIIVTIARNIGDGINAQVYNINFDGSKKMTVRGTWKEIP